MSSGAVLEHAPTEPGDRDVPWRRVDPRTGLAQPLDRLAHLMPFFIAAILFSERLWLVIANVAVAVLLVCAYLVTWLTTRYRITDEHLELRHGLLIKKHKKVPRDRIRAVDLTSSYLYRVLRIVRVRVGTGDHRGLTLTALSRAEGARLRTVLLRRRASRTAPSPKPEILASFTPHWVRYAPLSLTGWAAVTAVCGTLFSIAKQIDDNQIIAAATRARDWVLSHQLWITAALVAATALLIVAAGTICGYLLQYWNFRLARTDESVRIHRGLLTTFSRTVATHRIRGIELIEQLPTRLARGGQLAALTTGLGAAGDRVILLPPAPIHTVREVSAHLLRTDTAPLTQPIQPHPPAALRRRLVRALAPVIGVATTCTVIAGVGPWLWAWTLMAPAAALGWDRYRSLGNSLTPHYLITRSGSFYRHTVALQREGIIGWHITQTWGQRRAGLLTLTAATAAGTGGYSVVDVDTAHGLRLATRAAAGLLDDITTPAARDSEQVTS